MIMLNNHMYFEPWNAVRLDLKCQSLPSYCIPRFSAGTIWN
jgi:hypothetical protein